MYTSNTMFPFLPCMLFSPRLPSLFISLFFYFYESITISFPTLYLRKKSFSVSFDIFTYQICTEFISFFFWICVPPGDHFPLLHSDCCFQACFIAVILESSLTICLGISLTFLCFIFPFFWISYFFFLGLIFCFSRIQPLRVFWERMNETKFRGC